MPLRPEHFPDLDRVAHPLQRIVSINQQNTIIGHGLRVRFERLQFRIEAHHPAVGMGSRHGYPVKFPREEIGSPGAAPNVSSVARRQTTVHSLGATQAELDDWLA